MRSILLVLAVSGLAPHAALAKQRRAVAPPPQAFETEIARYAQMHGVPESLIHRVIVRESRYNPRLVSRHRHYGLMQISYPTARSMGYSGPPAGLLDPDTNLAYAVPYLANAYRAAGRTEAGAMRLYASGYYYVAKRRGMLPDLRTAGSPTLAPPPAPSGPPQEENPFLSLFGLATAPAPAQAPPEAAAQP